jgi:hypothetical protein
MATTTKNSHAATEPTFQHLAKKVDLIKSIMEKFAGKGVGGGVAWESAWVENPAWVEEIFGKKDPDTEEKQRLYRFGRNLRLSGEVKNPRPAPPKSQSWRKNSSIFEPQRSLIAATVKKYSNRLGKVSWAQAFREDPALKTTLMSIPGANMGGLYSFAAAHFKTQPSAARKYQKKFRVPEDYTLKTMRVNSEPASEAPAAPSTPAPKVVDSGTNFCPRCGCSIHAVNLALKLAQ